MKRSFRKLSSLSLQLKLAVALLIDLATLVVALWAAYALRLSDWTPDIHNRGPWLLFAAPVICVVILYYSGFYRTVIRYFGPKTIQTAIKSMTVAALLLMGLALLTQTKNMPRSVFIIFWGASILALIGTRQVARYLMADRPLALDGQERVAIYGAGSAGRQLVGALARGGELKPVLFIDDVPGMHGREIHGLAVHPSTALSELVDSKKLSRILLAMPNVSKARQREILEKLEGLAVKVMVMPSVGELATGRVKVNDLREVEIEDLLGREPVVPDPALLETCIAGKSVMVTGAGGSIGSELCRQILQLHPAELVLYEMSELALYLIEQELQRDLAPDSKTRIVPILGSVQDRSRLETSIRRWKVQTIYHAAAYKHVPLVEHNPLEGLRNNVLGTLKATQAAVAAAVETFVLVSTDKAVRPTNVMGASKRLAELIVQALARESPATRLCMVRFGNVLASSGSVVPLFREQIRQGGPVTVTDPEMIRYFMTIPEAAQLVVQAGALGQTGEVFVLDMGEPVRIQQLAERMIRLSGLTLKDEKDPDGDISIVYTGLRPGEKLYEELLIAETDIPTRHPRIRCAQEEFLSWHELEAALHELQQAMDQHDLPLIQAILRKLVHGYLPAARLADYAQAAISEKNVVAS